MNLWRETLTAFGVLLVLFLLMASLVLIAETVR